MPLSEHEQRLLDEMERNLYQNDADFVAKVSAARTRPGYRSVIVGVLVAVIGVAGLVLGVAFKIPLVGVLGFAVMFAGVILAITPQRGARSHPAGFHRPGAQPTRPKVSQSDFMDRLNDRWDKRQDGSDS